MSSLNKVLLLGNLARDPEVRYGGDGNKIVSFSLATSEQWKDKNTGERKERAEFHRVVIFNDRLSGVAEQYLKKGAKVYLEGQLATRKWTDNSGQDRYTTEVVLQRFRGELLMVGGRAQGEWEPAGGAASSAPSAPASSGLGASPADAPPKAQAADPATQALKDLDDDIPF